MLIPFFSILTFLFMANAEPTASPIQVKKTQGLELKNLSSPKESRNLKWQRIVVGQERLDGATLVGVPSDSVWRRLGFEAGDMIVNIDGRQVRTQTDLDRALSKAEKGQRQSIDFKIIRGNQEMLLNYKLSW